MNEYERSLKFTGVLGNPMFFFSFPHTLGKSVGMGDVLESLTDKHVDWAMDQKVFFVSTAPRSEDGHINCSPKGGDCFRFLDYKTFIYADYTSSGNETIAHLSENGRILIMFRAFKGSPRIMRLHGKGTPTLPGRPEFEMFKTKLPKNPGLRSIIKVAIDRASVSCGSSVPFFDFVKHRDSLDKWTKSQGSEGLAAYRQKKNRTSIDGLPGYGQLAQNQEEP
ncbi:MAG: pyridoxamine 5'-phosphate oxidase family protein [Verrucomicrobia bacterium]|nr:pyridoxamine 5'-phosphate oxidase family protein [Verrucomicrobiota bacterium]